MKDGGSNYDRKDPWVNAATSSSPNHQKKKIILNELLLCYFDWYAIVSNQIILANWMLGEQRKGENERMVERRNSVAKNMAIEERNNYGTRQRNAGNGKHVQW